MMIKIRGRLSISGTFIVNKLVYELAYILFIGSLGKSAHAMTTFLAVSSTALAYYLDKMREGRSDD